jgi:hypothetical protein
VPETPTPDFYTRAAWQLRTANGDDTVVIATLNGEFMQMQTRAPRGAPELVYLARRLLDEASDLCIEAESAAESDNLAEPHAELRCAIEDALASLPDMAADADDAEG